METSNKTEEVKEDPAEILRLAGRRGERNLLPPRGKNPEPSIRGGERGSDAAAEQLSDRILELIRRQVRCEGKKSLNGKRFAFRTGFSGSSWGTRGSILMRQNRLERFRVDLCNRFYFQDGNK